MKLATVLRIAEKDLGAIDLRHQDARSLEDFSCYADDPVGFIRDVLGCTDPGPWAQQEAVAGALQADRYVLVQSCNGAGKDWLAARLALWWVYARRGLALVLGPTERQVREVVMRNEVRTAFNALPDLPGDLYELALRVEGSGGLLAMTSTDASKLTGFHHPNGVLICITEAQAVEAHTWEAARSNATGADCAILGVCNPLAQECEAYEVSRSPRWRTFELSAFDCPNVTTNEARDPDWQDLEHDQSVIPGGVTRAFVAMMRADYGEDSPQYQSRVLGRWPDVSEEALVTRAMWDRAVELHRAGVFEAEAAARMHTLGVDPARMGPDRSVVCDRQGPIVRGFVEWRGLDTQASAERVENEVRTLGGVDRVVVDEIGLGGGVLDRLRRTLPDIRQFCISGDPYNPSPTFRSPRAEGFIASAGAFNPERFANRRSEAAWHLRNLLEAGKLALPDNPQLREEVLKTRVRFNTKGKIELESKDALKSRLGRSPDYYDALVISLAPETPQPNARQLRTA